MSNTFTGNKPTVTSLSAPPKHYGLFVVFIAIIGAFSSLVNDMYLPTIPSMMREFHTDPSMTQMGISMAMAGMGIGSLLWESASDRYGRKPILIISLLIFVVSTAVALLSRGITFFVVCRFFQGVGAGGAMVLSTSIPADIYMGRQLAGLMAVVGAVNGIAPALAPVVGGFMAAHTGWRGIFMVLLAVGVVMAVWTCRYRETLPPSRRIQGGGMKGYAKNYRVLLSDRRFMLYVVIKAVGIGLLYAYISSAPFIIQDHYGFSDSDFGLIFGANALLMGAGSMIVLKFRVLKQGMVAGCIGMFLFAVAGAAALWSGAGFLWYEIFAAPMLGFSGMIFSSANTLSMEVGHAEAGTASAVLSIVKYAFAAVVAPLVGIGDIMRSTAVMYVAVSTVAVVLAVFAWRMKPLPDMVRGKK